MSSSSAPVVLNLGPPPAEKLSKGNYLLWKAQVMPGLRGAQVTGLLDGTDAAPPTTVEQHKSDKTMEVVPNPLYAPWLSKDQQVLSYLMNSLSKEVLAQFVGKENTYDLWTGITTLFASQSQSRITNLRIAITTTKKGSMSSTAYISKMKSLGDELAAAGCPVSDPEMVDYVLAGLNRDYDPVVAAIGAVKTSINVDELFAQIAAFDQRMEMLGDGEGGFNTSTNLAYRGRGQYRSRARACGTRGRGRGRRSPSAPSSSNRGARGGRPQQQNQQRQQNRDYPECQICLKHHRGGARACWDRYEEDEEYERAVEAACHNEAAPRRWQLHFSTTLTTIMGII